MAWCIWEELIFLYEFYDLDSRALVSNDMTLVHDFVLYVTGYKKDIYSCSAIYIFKRGDSCPYAGPDKWRSTWFEEQSSVSVVFPLAESSAEVYVPMTVGVYPSLTVYLQDKDGNMIEGSLQTSTGEKVFARANLILNYKNVFSGTY